MVFSSSIFIFIFLPFFLLFYYLLPRQLKNFWIVLASLLFYAWGAPKYVLVVVLAMLGDYLMARLISKSSGSRRKGLLFLGVSLNVSLLLYFKYFNFFMDNFNSLLSLTGMEEFSYIKVMLPIGISFFTFHEISYLVDVYRSKKEPFKSIIDYSLYILFFPQLIAGPIIRFNEISDQILNNSGRVAIDDKLSGFFRFIIGLTKKVLIANICGAHADFVFGLGPHQISTLTAWSGALAYTIQIYFDFSGYSDMAIGLARMLGFRFPENFNVPYIASSITDFWRRWHMTLSRWIRDYLYISLGGNQVSTGRMYLNLIICFLISGLWHGAEWTFIIWGVYHGLFLIIDKLFLLRLLEKLPAFISISFTFFLTVLGWVIFRSPDLDFALTFYKQMFSGAAGIGIDHYSKELLYTGAFAIIVSFLPAFKAGERIQKLLYSESFTNSGSVLYMLFFLSLFLLDIAAITTSGFNPFIYFRF
jgi:alginate O-acetyltransferase complex protein AlgI